MRTCHHLGNDLTPPEPSGHGCYECEQAGQHNWVHLRLCQGCGHVGCCDNSPGKHATAHYRAIDHPLARSFEPGEDWWWCYPEELHFHVEGEPPAPSYS